MTYTFTIQGKLPGLNDIIGMTNTNRYANNDLKRRTTTFCAQYARAAGIPKIEKPIEISVEWYEPNMRRDPDNIRTGIKYILDGLVVAERIPNDTRKWIHSIKDEFLIDRINPRVVVTLTEVETLEKKES